MIPNWKSLLICSSPGEIEGRNKSGGKDGNAQPYQFYFELTEIIAGKKTPATVFTIIVVEDIAPDPCANKGEKACSYTAKATERNKTAGSLHDAADVFYFLERVGWLIFFFHTKHFVIQSKWHKY